MPALDGLRGIAILLVIGVHVNFAIPGGWLGVELFFVLSGFLITSLLIGEWSTTDAVSVRAFYRRRVYRLVPALVFLLAAYTAVIGGRQALGFGGDLGHSLSGVGYALIYLSNVVDPMSIPLELHHTWSLAQEEQFYLVWPLALLASSASVLAHAFSPCSSSPSSSGHKPNSGSTHSSSAALPACSSRTGS